MRRVFLLASLGIVACLNPPASPPSTVPASALGPFASLPIASIEDVPDDWWRLYDDPVLDRFVESSLTANADLRVAFANLEAARALTSQAQALRFPQLGVESGVTLGGASKRPSSALVPSTKWDVAATMSWELDLFGRLRASALAARADAEAQEAALDALKVAIAADTVQSYADLCGATRGLTEAREIADSQERLARLVEKQLQAGDVSPLELSQAATLAASSRAAVIPFEAQRANALYRLATLQGRPPAESRSFDVHCDEAPRLGRAAPVGDGTALLLRRPDVREAERRLAAAAARIGVARADLYPRLNFGGALGLLAGRFDVATTPLIPRVLFNQGPARARLEQSRANERAALASWDAVILRALREVETALVSYDAEVRRNQILATAVTEAEAYARRAEARVRLGDAASLLEVDARRVLATARLQNVQSDLAVGQSEVALFRALGGGWRVDSKGEARPQAQNDSGRS